jgi:hypothetical protein
MRISMPSRARILVLATIGCAAAALAQDSARQQIGRQGSAALDRLAGALAKGKDSASDQPRPTLPPPPTEQERRRAFEGLRNRISDKAIDARASAALAKSEAALAIERQAQAKRLRQALGLEPDETEALAKAKPVEAGDVWVPVLFVSSSMPVAILRSYAAQLERVHGVLAFRGMPGGLRQVGPMAKLSAQILRLDPGCEGPSCAMRNVQLIVDPILFRMHGVARVPALAMVPGDPLQAYCERDEGSPRAAHLVFGDSALGGLLDEYARLGGEKEVRSAQALLAPR